ncbi:hypothetical protein QWJ06_11655 [Kocuria rhizophila]|uniref:hypothetical protein n=1 Tax=Kocuria rhizophila TaxID=72000 RepID=UPI001ADA704C|nr:hypothetical protein [Kocuria rhizophila]MDN3227366.1 hypothetical protein [Kocuria rhizophila]QTK30730.1 hypothetical protein J5U48_06745 [Kocuria rhizophila]
MPKIPCQLRSFTLPNRSTPQRVAITEKMLLDCAATVGMPTIASHPARRRPLAEMQWRTGIVAANLRPTASGHRWTRTEAYANLDPSEKSAVSYFLGMTQAALTTRYVLGYSHLVHVDLLLQHQGAPLGGRRPDFVAVDPTSTRGNAYSAVVEAKGRSNDFEDGPLDRAKDQVATTPAIRGLAPIERIASVAYFDEDYHWASVLKDPDGVGGELKLGLESFLFLYYRTIIEAGRESETWELVNGHYRFALPDFPIEFQVPQLLVEAYDTSAEIISTEERDAEAPILTSYYEIAETVPGNAGDLVTSRFREGASAATLVELFELRDE